MRDHHVKTGKYDVLGRRTVQRAGSNIADDHLLASLTHIDTGRIEADTDGLILAVELVVIEPGQNYVVHGMARPNFRQQLPYQQTSKGGGSIREVINVGLAPFWMGFRGQLEPGKPRIAERAEVCRGNRVASQSKKAEGAALETVRRLLIAAADFDQVIPVTRSPEQQELFLSRFAGERIARFIIEPQQLPLAGLRDGEVSDDGGERSFMGTLSREFVFGCRNDVARYQHVTSERFARKKMPDERPSEG